MPRIIIDFSEFAREQGPYFRDVRGVSNRTGLDVSVFRFRNGALSDGRTNHTPPPTDPAQRLRLQGAYLSAVLADEERAWNAAYRRAEQQISYAEMNPEACPPPSARLLGQLKEGKKRIAQLREELAELQQRIAQLPEEQKRLRRQEAIRQIEREQRREARRVASDLMSLAQGVNSVRERDEPDDEEPDTEEQE
jgi:hypothetical protein